MFDFEVLDCLEDGLQRLDNLTMHLSSQANHDHGLRDVAASLRKTSAQLVAESKRARGGLPQA